MNVFWDRDLLADFTGSVCLSLMESTTVMMGSAEMLNPET
jgi:hypothetical protein